MTAPLMVAGLLKRRAVIRAVIAATTTVLYLCVLVFVGGVLVMAASSANAFSVCSTIAVSGGRTPGRGVGASEIRDGDKQAVELTAGQVAVAQSYIAVGRQLAVPKDGQIVAIMMALQESSLRVLANTDVPASLGFPHDGTGSDHDSLGTAQQRPVAGWGSVAQLMDPTYDARAFYGGPTGPNHGSPPGLLDIPGWASLDKGQAAQAVQVSAFPELYSRWEGEATAIVGALEGGAVLATCNRPSDSSPFPATPANLSQIRLDILKFAQKGLGGAYVWGGTEFRAWDCSGYVQWIYRQVRIDLPRVEQWRVGTRTDDPRPGDLVVQNPQGRDNWGHVGIYAGNGMMYSALNPAAGTLLHPVSWNTGTAYFDLLGGLPLRR